jgi:hypothetical protein
MHAARRRTVSSIETTATAARSPMVEIIHTVDVHTASSSSCCGL